MSMADHTEPLRIAPDPETLHLFHRQQLSAMLDGELSPDEAKFMLRRLEHDVELARCWERWQLCGEVMRGRADGLLPGDFAARVAVAVQGPVAGVQVGLNAPRRSRRMVWGGMGLAASLAALAAVLVVMLPEDRALPDAVAVSSPTVLPEAEMAAVATASVTEPAGIPVAPAPTLDASAAVAAITPARELLAPASVVPAPVPVLPRPWPRAGGGSGAFNVGYGAPPAFADPFQPRWVPPSSVFWPETGASPAPSRQD